MDKKSVLKIGEFPAELQAIIDKEFTCHSETQVMQDAVLRNSMQAILTRSICTIEHTLIEQLPELKVIATSGVGYDGIPVEFAHSRGIAVTNTPGVLDSAVCELAVGLLLSLLRQLPAADRHVKENKWKDGAFRLTSSLKGKRVGIVGLGRIGHGIAARLCPFEVSLAYSDAKKQSAPYDYYPNVVELAKNVDILMVCCPGGEATRGMINAQVLENLGSEGFLINVSRGSVVDETALIAALDKATIRGVALDVYESEPIETSQLTQFENTVLTPHVGSATQEIRHAMLRLTLDNLHQVFAGGDPITPVLPR